MADSKSQAPTDVDALLEFAALSGSFDPAAALRALSEPTAPDVPLAASRLAAACDTNPDETSSWVMHSARRREILDGLATSKRLNVAVARRRATEPLDMAARDILDAITSDGLFSRQELTEELADPTSRELVIRLTTALDRVGELSPSYALLGNARSALAKLDRRARRDALSKRGFFGRDDELDTISARLATTANFAPDPAFAKRGTPKVRGLFIFGMPGIGKSALLEEVIERRFDEERVIVVRLDFDRAGLDVNNPRFLIMEIARQVADRVEVGAERLLELRLDAARGVDDERSRRTPSERLGSEIANVITQSGRPLMLVVDTFEALQARGLTQPETLFQWFDWLIDKGIPAYRILIAGRAPPNDGERLSGEPFELQGIGSGAAAELLTRLKVDPQFQKAANDCARGNPLALRLAASIIADNGADELPKEGLEAAIAAGFLYRILLSRIQDDVLRKLAHPGLIVRRISARLLKEVVGPQVGLDELSDADAQRLFDDLSRQHWLVQSDPSSPEFVRHHPDMRAQLLPLLYREDPVGCGRIDGAAARWFGQQHDPWSPVDALYHRLQQLRRQSVRPAIPIQTARLLDADAIAELPERAQILVRQTIGESATTFGLAAGSPDDVSRLTQELTNQITRGDWREGLYLVDRIRESGAIDPASELADAVRALWWRAGQWNDAAWLLRERDRLGHGDDDLYRMHPVLAAARIEMRGELGGPFVRQLLGNPPQWQDVPRSGFGKSRLARAGGWGFRLAARADPGLETFPSGEMPDVVAAVLDHERQEGGKALGEAMNFAERRLGSLAIGLNRADPGWVTCQMLCSLSPHADQIDVLREREYFGQASAVAAALLESEHSLLRIGNAFRISPQSRAMLDNPIAAITVMGLFAEWAGAFAFLHRDLNLRAVGRAAEQWRRTVAGDWRYSKRPAGWGKPKVDAVLAARIDHCLHGPDPIHVALEQLHLWAPEREDGTAVWEQIQRRAPKSLIAASRFDEPVTIARSLAQYGMPAAFIPSVVALLTFEFDPI